MSGQEPYTLHKPVSQMFPRMPYTITNIDDVWKMDPVDISSFSKYDKYKYTLNVIDIYSRCAWSVPLNDNHSRFKISISK